MSFTKVTIFIIISLILACANIDFHSQTEVKRSIIDTSGAEINTRFLCPIGFIRDSQPTNSYATFLQTFALYNADKKVKYYNGETKNNPVYEAVLKIDVGKRDLQQCADAVMRLRAEYLFKQKRYSEISFRFLGDGKMHSYLSYAGADRSYSKFRKYMNYIFAFANTGSLKKQLKKVNINSAQIGDVFIQSGNPYGHAICIMDMCKDTTTGKTLVLLAQSYMPAQEIHILKNYNNSEISPWYSLDQKVIDTPEWDFYSSDLKRF